MFRNGAAHYLLCSFVEFRGTNRVVIAAGSGAVICLLPACVVLHVYIVDGQFV